MDKKTGKRRIWIYKDKITGKGKGEATITYDDPPTASSAINWFGGKIVKSEPCENLIASFQYTADYIAHQILVGKLAFFFFLNLIFTCYFKNALFCLVLVNFCWFHVYL